MNYEQTIAYLYGMLPMFTRIGKAAIKKDLNNTLAFCKALQNPHQKFKSIHIAGTNGKGSTSHMLAAILQTQGYKTGLYTSPHLLDFRERIRINGKPVSKEFVIEFVQNNLKNIETIKPSFFECTVAMAFDYFAREAVDVAVIETGLGGRLDSTNVITPQVSIITNIGFDHMDLLGDTLDKIAFEKAGIIKPNVPVIIGEYVDETKPVFLQKAESVNAPIVFAQDIVKINEFNLTAEGCNISIQTHEDEYKNIHCDLGGIYQKQNISTVVVATEIIQKTGFPVSKQAIYNGLKQTKKITGLMGRWQILKQQPLTVCDVAHNIDGIAQIVKQLNQISYENLHIVFGMVKDKDITNVLNLLPNHATYYFTKADLPRALNEKELQQQALEKNLQGNSYDTVAKAIDDCLNQCKMNDMIYIGGSTFVVAEALGYFGYQID